MLARKRRERLSPAGRTATGHGYLLHRAAWRGRAKGRDAVVARDRLRGGGSDAATRVTWFSCRTRRRRRPGAGKVLEGEKVGCIGGGGVGLVVGFGRIGRTGAPFVSSPLCLLLLLLSSAWIGLSSKIRDEPVSPGKHSTTFWIVSAIVTSPRDTCRRHSLGAPRRVGQNRRVRFVSFLPAYMRTARPTSSPKLDPLPGSLRRSSAIASPVSRSDARGRSRRRAVQT